MASENKTVIIACAVMQEELERIRPAAGRIIYLPQSLHRTPQIMASSIQKELDSLEPGSTHTVLMAYGLCSNGIVGVKATRGEIIIPRVHDCIGIFLGSLQRYIAQHQENPGTYYLTPGWIREQKDPLGILEEYRSRLNSEDAEWCIRQEFKNYTRIALIHMGGTILDPIRERAIANARFFGMSYEEILGADHLLQKLVRMERTDEFVVVPPGGVIESEPFTAQ